MPKIKRIPDKLRLYLKPGQQVTRDIYGQKHHMMVRKGFMVDASNEKTNYTANRWCDSGGTWYWDSEQRKRVEYEDERETIELDNKPFDSLIVYNIDYRGEGGQAYKVRTQEGWAFDVRAEFMLDQIIERGIEIGGVMKGPFVWGRCYGGQLSIMSITSHEYREALKADSPLNKPPKRVKIKDLEIGGVYATTAGRTGMYLGRGRDPRNNKLIFKFADFYFPNYAYRDEEFKNESLDEYIKRKAIEYREKYDEQRINPPRRTYPWASVPVLLNRNETKVEFRTSHSYVEKVAQVSQETIDKYMDLVEPSKWDCHRGRR